MGCAYGNRRVINEDNSESLLNGNKVCESSKSRSIVKEWDMFLRGRDRKYIGLGQDVEGDWSGDFEFIWMGDPQIGFGDEEKEKENMRQTVEFINERFETGRRIKFVVVCGDHTHNFENIWSKKDSLEVNREKRKAQLKDYKSIWLKLNPKIPLVCVCGNHDVGNIPTERTIRMYTEEFGDDYLAFWAGGVKFLIINSQLVQHPEESETLALRQEDWFKKELKKDNAPIVFAHIPPFCWHVDENDVNFNWPKVTRMKWLDWMVEAGVRNMYCAHYHRRAGGTYNGLKVMVTGAVGTVIFTKDLPEDVKEDEVKKANFKISFEGFGGLSAEPKDSGLYVVTVKKEGTYETWMSIGDISKKIQYGKRKEIPQEKKE